MLHARYASVTVFVSRLTGFLCEQRDVMRDDLSPLHDGQRETYVGHVPLWEQRGANQPGTGKHPSERGQSGSALACKTNAIFYRVIR